MAPSYQASPLIVQFGEQAVHRLVLDGAGQSGNNCYEDKELCGYLLVLDGGGDLVVILFLANEMDRDRLVLDGAPFLLLPVALAAGAAVPLDGFGVLRAPLLLHFGMGAAVGAVLGCAVPSVVGTARDARRLVFPLAPRLAFLG